MSTVILADFQWNGDQDLLRAKNLEQGGRVQQAIDNAVISYCMQYVPWDSGVLGKSPYSASPPGCGHVTYNTPYARYQYYGVVYGPNIPVFDDNSGEPTRFYSRPGMPKSPKVPAQQLQYSQDVNPLAGSFWFERMKADHSDDILREAKSVAAG